MELREAPPSHDFNVQYYDRPKQSCCLHSLAKHAGPGQGWAGEVWTLIMGLESSENRFPFVAELHSHASCVIYAIMFNPQAAKDWSTDGFLCLWMRRQIQFPHDLLSSSSQPMVKPTVVWLQCQCSSVTHGGSQQPQKSRAREATFVHYRQNPDGNLKGCKHIGQKPFYFPPSLKPPCSLSWPPSLQATTVFLESPNFI